VQKIIDWKNRDSWENIIISACNKILGTEYIDIIENNADKIICPDDYEEVCNLFSSLKNEEEILNFLINELKNSITHIQAYHACRPQNIESYYKNGIIPLSSIDIQLYFRKFLLDADIKISSNAIEFAISKVSIGDIEGITHLILDDRTLISRCGHYLIYGSEYLNTLVINLPQIGEYARNELKKFGKATIFVCKISIIHLSNWKELAQRMLAEHAYAIVHGRTNVHKLSHTIFMKERVPPENICYHYHPKLIKDPYKNKTWNDEENRYEL
jgi:hypothetical protein